MNILLSSMSLSCDFYYSKIFQEVGIILYIYIDTINIEGTYKLTAFKDVIFDYFSERPRP